MSDSEDYDYDDFGGADYYYLEDEYGPADDLAEHACPSPIQYAGDDDWDEHTRFTSYWEDLNYNSDSYFSEKEYAKRDKKEHKKRAADDEDRLSPAGKRLKFHTKSHPGSPILASEIPPPILWVKQSDRPTNSCRGRLVKSLGRSVKIVKDAERLMEQSSAFGKAKPKVKLEKVKDAVEDDPLDAMAIVKAAMAVPSQEDLKIDTLAAKDVGDADEDGWEDDDEGEGSEMDGDGEDEGPRIDPDMLKMALRQHLSAAGIKFDRMDEATLLRFATKMLSGEANSDDVAGELAGDLLGGDEAEEDEDSNAQEKQSDFAQWVSGQVKASTKESKEEADAENNAAVGAVPAAINGNGVKRKADHKEADDHPRPIKKRLAKSHRVLTVDLDDEESK